MKHLLIYFTKDLAYNNYFCDFVARKLEEKNIFANTIIKINNDESRLNALLSIDAKKYDDISIITDEYSFSNINKIIATMKTSELILEDDELIVKDYLKYSKYSVLLDLEGVKINILKASIFYIPEILHENKAKYDFLLKDIDLESAQILLETSIKPYAININIYNLLENLLYVKVNTNEYSDERGFVESVKSLFSNKIILSDNIFAYVKSKLLKANKKLSFAESCSGGLIASNFTKLEGASNVYEGSVITYSNKSKKAWLNVNEEYLEGANVYSQNCAQAMAQGVLRLTKSNYAISCTGVLGAKEDLGVKSGVVYICAISDEGVILHERLELKGDRIYMQEQCALACMLLLTKLDERIF